MGWEKPATVWWNRIKKLWLFVLGGLLFVFIVVLRLIGPMIGEEYCTLTDTIANEGVVVNLIGHDLPGKYTVEVDFPTGKEVVDCDSSQNDCSSNGAYFRQPESGYPPNELTVIVIIDNKQVTQTFTPEYEIILPNGEGCEPVYYRTEIDFPITQ